MEILITTVITLFLGLTSIVVLFNFFSAPKVKKQGNDPREDVLVSILIPARNEEANIRECLEHALKQTHPNIEVLVLDDQSEDGTFAVVQDIQKRHSKLALFRGQDLPPGWNGKNWACHQLSRKARGEFVVFVDADCLLSPWAVESALRIIERYSLDLLSCFPTQKLQGLAGLMIVPLMDWLLLSFLPLRLVYLSSKKSFVAANGQFMAFARKSYDAIGGHARVANQVVEDMELARGIKAHGLKMMTALGAQAVYCKMYSSFTEAFRGFSKNFFPGFNTTAFRFSCLLVGLAFFYLAPFVLVFVYPTMLLPVSLIFLQRVILAFTDGQNPVINALLHPLQMLLMPVVGVNSMHVTLNKRMVWKGRNL